MARKRWTRKALKEPDKFLSLSQRAWEFVRGHVKVVGLALLGAALVLGAVAVAASLSGRSDAAATSLLSEALEAAYTPVRGPTDQGPAESDPDNPEADKTARFASVKERAEAVLGKLDALDRQHGSSDAAGAGRALRAGTLADLGRMDEAEKAWRALIAFTEPDDPLRVLAREGLGYVYEARGQLDKAAAEFREIAPSETSPMRDRATWHEARILERMGKKAAARKAYEQILLKNPLTALREEIHGRLAALP
jgi:tetratricopeptide (TPR) repeat protein